MVNFYAIKAKKNSYAIFGKFICYNVPFICVQSIYSNKSIIYSNISKFLSLNVPVL